jgi:hypothetical protein
MPSGLSRSDAIFARSLFGARPIDDDSPVAARTAALIDSASERARAAQSSASASRATVGGGVTAVRSMKISSMPQFSISGAIARTAALNRFE